jgi:hypothetical protein
MKLSQEDLPGGGSTIPGVEEDLIRKRGVRWRFAVVVCAAMLGSAERGWADTDESRRTAAETLFVEAKKLMEAGKYGDACPKFADSQRLDPAVGTLLNLAVCYDRSGKVASAWSAYREAAGAARAAGQSERERMARESAAALESRLSRLTITVPPSLAAAEDVVVKVDATALPPSLWGVPMPSDPGEHVVEVSAKGKKPWTTHIQLAPPSVQSVVVPSLEPASSKDVARVSADVPAASAADKGDMQRTMAIVLGGVGVVGAALGAGFGISAGSTYHDADSECSGANVCSPHGIELRNSAYSRATVSTVAFSVAGAALVSGAILWFTAPSRGQASRVGVAIEPPIRNSPWALSIHGAW